MGKTLEYSQLKSQIKQISNNELWVEELKEFIDEWTGNKQIFIVPTSGSTGKSKNISIHREDLIRSANYTVEFLGLRTGMTSLLCLPVKYIAGKLMFIRSIEAGLNCQVVKPSSNPFLDIREEIHFVAITPFQLHNILKNEETKERLADVQTIIIGGGVPNSKDLNVIRDFDSRVYLTYGMTETLTHIAMSELRKSSKKIEYKLVNHDFSISTGKNGQLHIESPYIHMRSVLSNDIVEITGEDRFILKGRIDNVINSGGIKIFPEEIERDISSFMSLPYFIAAIEDDSLGQRMILVVESEKDDPSLLEELRSGIEKNISSSIQRPKEIRILPKFVYTDNGKIQRNETLNKLL